MTMVSGITVSGVAIRLGELAVPELLHEAAERGAALLEDRVRERLSGGPGGAHEAPWLQTGGLRDSIGSVVAADGDGVRAMVGSSDPAAVPQELGTLHMAARPFLAPVGAELGGAVADAVRAVVAAELRRGLGGG